MRVFIAVTITVLCFSLFVPRECFAASSPELQQGDAVKGADENRNNNATVDEKKTRDDGPKIKIKGSDRKEPEYDMDLEIDPESERC